MGRDNTRSQKKTRDWEAKSAGTTKDLLRTCPPPLEQVKKETYGRQRGGADAVQTFDDDSEAMNKKT